MPLWQDKPGLPQPIWRWNYTNP